MADCPRSPALVPSSSKISSAWWNQIRRPASVKTSEVANQASTVSVLLGNGDGTFASKVDYGTGLSPHSVAVEDLNLDGKPDLAVANYAGAGGNGVSVLLGNGDGTFAPKVDYAPGSHFHRGWHRSSPVLPAPLRSPTSCTRQPWFRRGSRGKTSHQARVDVASGVSGPGSRGSGHRCGQGISPCRIQ